MFFVQRVKVYNQQLRSFKTVGVLLETEIA
jgi:hypothetical protein